MCCAQPVITAALMWSLGGTQASYYCHRGKKNFYFPALQCPLCPCSSRSPAAALCPPSSLLPGPRPPCLVQTHIHFSHCCNRRPFCFWCVNYPDTRPHGRVADMGVFSSLCVCVCVLARSAHLTYESRNGAGPSSVSNPVGCG